MTVNDLAYPRRVTSEAPSATTGRTSAQPWLLPVLIAATFVSLVHYIAFSPLLPLMSNDLGLTVGVLGQVPAAIGLGAALLGPIVGPLADRHGHRRALLLGLLALVASSTAVAVGPGLAMLPLAALLGAAGRATVYPVALAVAGTRFEGDARRQAISRVTTSLSVAPILGIPLLTAVAESLGWRVAFLVAAGLTAALLLAVQAVLAGPTQAEVPEAAPAGDLFVAYQPLLAHRPSLGVIGSTFLLSAGGWITWTYLGTFTIEQYGFSTREAGWAWLVVGLGLLGGGLLGSSRLGKAPLRPLLVVAAAGAGVCLASGLVLPLAAWAAVGAIALGTLLHGLTQVASALLLSQETPAGHAATMTLRGSAQSLGAAVGSALGGVLLPLASFSALGVAALLCCVGGAALAWQLRTAETPNVTAAGACGCVACLAKAPV